MKIIFFTFYYPPDLCAGSFRSVSLAHELSKKLNNGDEAFYKIPDTRKEVANILLLLEIEKDRVGLDTVVNEDYSQTRLRFFTSITPTNQDVLRLDRLTQKTLGEFFPHITKKNFTGRPFINARMIDLLPKAMVRSVGIALIIISLFMILLYRSVYVGLISMIPNIAPMVLIMGFMGFADIWVNLATSMVFAVALGIAVDDSIHLIWAMQKNVGKGLSYPDALKQSFADAGVPITISTIVLSSGFLMLNFSSVWPTTSFGNLVALCCVIALLADLLLTPALLLVFKPFRVKKT